jgi:N-formylglutamate deformylase
LSELLAGQGAYSQVVNGRFKGGFITRHYGRPDLNQHAVQLEMCWRCYMRETPPHAQGYDETLAAQVQPLLRQLLERLLSWAPAAR